MRALRGLVKIIWWALLTGALAVLLLVSACLLVNYALSQGRKAAKPLHMLRATNKVIRRTARIY